MKGALPLIALVVLVVSCSTAVAAQETPVKACSVTRQPMKGGDNHQATVICKAPCDATYNISVELVSSGLYGASLGAYPIAYSACGNQTNRFRVSGHCHMQHLGFISHDTQVQISIIMFAGSDQVVTVTESVDRVGSCTVLDDAAPEPAAEPEAQQQAPEQDNLRGGGGGGRQ